MDREQKIQQAKSAINDISSRISALSGNQQQAQQPTTPTVDVSEINAVEPIKITTPDNDLRVPSSSLDISSRLATNIEERDSLADKISDIEERLIDSQDFKEDLRDDLDIEGRKESLNQSRKRLLRLEAEAANVDAEIDREFEGRVTNTRARRAMANNAKRDINIEQRLELATFEALQGDLNSSLDLYEDALRLEYEDEEYELGVYKTQLQELEGNISSDEQELYNQRLAEVEAEESRIASEKADKKEIRKLVITAIGNGADSFTHRSMLQAGSIDEAIEIGAKFLSKPQSTGGGGGFGGSLDMTVQSMRDQGFSDVDIKAYLDTNTGLTGGVIDEAVDGADKKFSINEDYIRTVFSEEQLAQFAASEKLYKEGSEPTWFTKGVGDSDAYVAEVLKTVQTYRDLGKTEKEIEDLIGI